MTTAHQCGVCGGHAGPDRHLCPSCSATASAALGAYWHRAATPYGPTPSLIDELETTAVRQSRMMAADDGSRGTHRPLPFDVTAADVLADDIAFLCRSVGVFGGPQALVWANSGTAAARWLHAHLQAVTGHPRVIDWAPDLARRHARAMTVIDRPPGTWYAGKCSAIDCQADLYAEDGAATIRCRFCGVVHDVEQQRARLLAGVESVLASAMEICRAVHLLDRPVTRSQINNWVARGQLVRRGRDAAGHHTYRVGDVLDLAGRGRNGRRPGTP